VLEREIQRPLAADVLATIRARTPVTLERPVAESIREDRRVREAS
jgi:hypothetical protein